MSASRVAYTYRHGTALGVVMLGTRQAELLGQMLGYADGHYPEHWAFRRETRVRMAALYDKGLVTNPYRTTALTTLGRQIAERTPFYQGLMRLREGLS